MADGTDTTDRASDQSKAGMPSLSELQHWTGMIGRAQQMMLETLTDAMLKGESIGAKVKDSAALPDLADAAGMAHMQADFWKDSAALWQRFLSP